MRVNPEFWEATVNRGRGEGDGGVGEGKKGKRGRTGLEGGERKEREVEGKGRGEEGQRSELPLFLDEH